MAFRYCTFDIYSGPVTELKDLGSATVMKNSVGVTGPTPGPWRTDYAPTQLKKVVQRVVPFQQLFALSEMLPQKHNMSMVLVRKKFEWIFFYWCPRCAEKSPRGSGGMAIPHLLTITTRFFFFMVQFGAFWPWFYPWQRTKLCMNSIKHFTFKNYATRDEGVLFISLLNKKNLCLFLLSYILE